jgi:hypothetical protein
MRYEAGMEKQEDYSILGKRKMIEGRHPKPKQYGRRVWWQWGDAKFSSFILLSTDGAVCHRSRKFSTTTK